MYEGELKERFYTYLWLREDGTPYYVGKGTGRRAFENKNHMTAVPKDKARIVVQLFTSEADAFTAEMFLIDFYGREDLGLGRLLNQTNGGDGPSGRRPVNKGKSPSLETRKKMSLAKLGKPSPNVGRPGHKHSEETKHKMSMAHKLIPGKPLSIETRAKLSQALKGRKVWNEGKKLSEEHRAKLSVAHTGLKQPQAQRENYSNWLIHRHHHKMSTDGCKFCDRKKA